MSRLLESVFVLGCAVVGFSMDMKEGSVMQDTVQCSVQFISNTHDKLSALGHLRIDQLFRTLK